ncbi:LOW QUALITY PROTEIN: hypothetical protein CVT26_002298 [Gymnopilus dilepis]|uniref:Uncharacterized protein n=1 Tax=Gymnopilus dilepis TaxID=231916 RepID=A0A409WEF4_9AGAR|nr:LOW QUALITY PROTEIN: hypothetical protein CVT26_002298 [Gymnopilus dilepis]
MAFDAPLTLEITSNNNKMSVKCIMLFFPFDITEILLPRTRHHDQFSNCMRVLFTVALVEGCLTLTVDQGDIGSCCHIAQIFKYQRPATSLHTDTRIVQ